MQDRKAGDALSSEIIRHNDEYKAFALLFEVKLESQLN